MESDMADIRGGYIYTCPGHEQGKKSVQITNDQTNPNGGQWWEGNGESPSFCKGQQIIIWRCVTSITNAVEKLLKLNYSCKTLNPERANTATPPRASHRPSTHTHKHTHTHSGKVNAYEKRQEAGKRLLFFLGAGESNLHILQQIDNKLQCDIQLSWWPRCPWLPAAVGQRWKL